MVLIPTIQELRFSRRLKAFACLSRQCRIGTKGHCHLGEGWKSQIFAPENRGDPHWKKEMFDLLETTIFYRCYS